MKRLSLQQVVARPDGCDVSNRCMDCPLAACRFDEPALLAKRLRQVKDLVAHRMRETGLLPPEIAAKLGWNERAGYRALEAGHSALKRTGARLPEVPGVCGRTRGR